MTDLHTAVRTAPDYAIDLTDMIPLLAEALTEYRTLCQAAADSWHAMGDPANAREWGNKALQVAMLSGVLFYGGGGDAS